MIKYMCVSFTVCMLFSKPNIFINMYNNTVSKTKSRQVLYKQTKNDHRYMIIQFESYFSGVINLLTIFSPGQFWIFNYKDTK